MRCNEVRRFQSRRRGLFVSDNLVPAGFDMRNSEAGERTELCELHCTLSFKLNEAFLGGLPLMLQCALVTPEFIKPPPIGARIFNAKNGLARVQRCTDAGIASPVNNLPVDRRSQCEHPGINGGLRARDEE